MTEYNVIDSKWFTPMGGGIIGVVLVKPAVGAPKAYIGYVWNVTTKEADEQTIAATGAKYPAAAALALFPDRVLIGD